MSARKIMVFMLMTTVVLAGCQSKKSNKSSMVRGRGAATYNRVNNNFPNTGSNQGNGYSNSTVNASWGEFTRGGTSQNQFQSNLNNMIGTDLGYISGDSGQFTGARFFGTINYNPNNSNSNSNINTDGSLEIWVYGQSTVWQSNPLSLYGGTASGNYVQLAFQDSEGWIILDGYFSGNYYQGNIWFGPGDNQMVQLGNFAVPACGFFSCY